MRVERGDNEQPASQASAVRRNQDLSLTSLKPAFDGQTTVYVPQHKAAFLMRGSRSRLRLMPSLAERGEHAMIVKDAHVPSPG